MTRTYQPETPGFGTIASTQYRGFGDREVTTIKTIVEAFESLEPDARRRVFAYLTARYQK